MSWFDTTGFASFAKSALTSAQKTIDKALDIQEEKASLPLNLTQRNNVSDGDSFFAAFGLSGKVPSPEKDKVTEQENVEQEKIVSPEHSNPQNSGFWTDTWGSFFEAKAKGDVKSESEEINMIPDSECSVKERDMVSPTRKKESAVLSQPQRAGLFPGEVHSSSKVVKDLVSDKQEDNYELGDENSSKLQIASFELLESSETSDNMPSINSQNLHSGTQSEDNKDQSDSHTSVGKHSLISSFPSQKGDLLLSSENQQLSADIFTEESVNNTSVPTICVELTPKTSCDMPNSQRLSSAICESPTDNESNSGETLKAVSIYDNNTFQGKEQVFECKKETEMIQTRTEVSNTISYIGEHGICSVDKSDANEFLTLNLQAISMDNHVITDNQKSEIGSEYDIVDLNEKALVESMKDSSSDSLDQSASVEVVTPASHCSLYDSDYAPVELPQLHGNMTNSFVSWEWSSLDGVTSTNDVCNSSCDTVIAEKGNEGENVEIYDQNLISSDTPSPCKIENKNDTLCSYIDSSNVPSASSISITKEKWVHENNSDIFVDSFLKTSREGHKSRYIDEHSTGSKDEDDDTETAEVRECEVKSSDSGGSQGTTSSSSFVKCSVEEADSSCSHRGQSPLSVTASERSDVTKLESEQNSGHTSGDENETATSSDIEILSPPNGENGERQSSSPLKHIWVPRPLRSRRSESPASDSSKDSIMPVVREVEEDNTENSLRSKLSKKIFLHKGDEAENFRKSLHAEDSLEKLLQRQEEMQEILEVRERRVLELSKENIELQEVNNKLTNQIQQMGVVHNKEAQDISALTKEFMQRLAQMEKKAQLANQERDSLKRQLEETQKEMIQRVTASEMEELLKEKEQQIQELTEEGAKLSKKELHHTTIIKKLRAKEDEMENTLKSQREKLEENSKEVERLRKSLGAKDEQEKKHIDAIRQLTTTVQKQDKEISTLESNLEDALEKERSLKNALESTCKEMTELRKTNAAKESEVQEVALSIEMAAKEKLRQTMEQTQRESIREKETMQLEIEDLRNSLTRAEDEAHLREKMLKADIANLQMRLQDSEVRNEELTRSISSATRPLVRQIESLQATYNTQISSWEKVEKNLTDRLSEAQKHLSVLSEKERSATEKQLELSSKVTKLESQNSLLRQDKAQLVSQVELMKSKIMMLEDSRNRECTSADNMKQSLAEEINKLKQEKEILSSDMLMCLDKIETERKKVLELQEELKLKERKLQIVDVSPCPSPSISHRSSVDSVHNWLQEESQDQGVASTPVNYCRLSVYESLRIGSATSLLENLQSQLKQREGEIGQLQSEIMQLERIRESMAHELVTLSGHSDQLEQELEGLKQVQESFKDLNQKYNTLLQMYGEKVEEAEELRLDLEDVKSMYKAQIEELLRSK